MHLLRKYLPTANCSSTLHFDPLYPAFIRLLFRLLSFASPRKPLSVMSIGKNRKLRCGGDEEIHPVSVFYSALGFLDWLYWHDARDELQ
jgi:hypothetical protein